jgi:pimeloyl-ACP methyl ester carboxylesterase
MTGGTRWQIQNVARLSMLALICASGVVAAAEREKPVARLARQVYTLHTTEGDVAVPMEISKDLNGAHPEITRVAIVLHGKGRNVEGYYSALERAAHEAGLDSDQTLLMAPQFLREEDAQAHHLPQPYLRWHAGSWTAGEPAIGPLPLSSFDVIDALLATLADRERFPNLTTVVLIGHSGGGQLLNRYAIVGKGATTMAGIHIRFVIANPSSYFYFSDDRPLRDGSFASFHDAACPAFDHWRYGPVNAPAYVKNTSSDAWHEDEQHYAQADVIYLLGTDDTDPNQVDLDTSCAGEAEGSERLDRGKFYFSYLKSRHPQELRHQLWFVRGVAHVGSRMVESPCAIAAVFEHGTCADTSTSANR